ncbi:hypothetical protein KUTeg_010826 [Tegillarca granosa]|uniref:Uncharacterized protein n=1 Tax=Tegillarca granosa TaxID=220873 RepID=A0ABQ9F5K0_TEGGR|nr:hypothetical protein KUTeg_010826 [Tegillarca granosa]
MKIAEIVDKVLEEQQSNEDVSHINILFEKPPGQSQFNVCYKLFCELKKIMLDKVAEPIRSSYREKAETERGKVYMESEGGLEKIRYIAGWCISSLKKHKRVAIQGKLYRPKEIESLRRLKTEIDLLGELESNESSPEIERKQNIRKGNGGITIIIEDLISKYSMMSLSQLRKEYLNLVKVKKTEAHRKQIKMRTKKEAEKSNIQTFLNEKSDGKLSSHRRLQSEIAAYEHYLVDSFTKKGHYFVGQILSITFQFYRNKERYLYIIKQKKDKEKIPRKRYHTDTGFQKKVHAGDRESQNEPSSSGSKEVSPKTKGEKYTEKRILRGKGKAN